jgi:chaperonin GroES
MSNAKLNLKPTTGYLLIEPLEKEVKTASGIYLPDTAGEKPQKGKVLAVGPAQCANCKCDDCNCKCSSEVPCKAGDVVIYKKWGGNEVKIGNIEYMFVKFEDILAVEV